MRRKSGRLIGPPMHRFAAGLVIALATLAAWASLSMAWIRWQAAGTADGRPSCIEIAVDDRALYRPAESLWDLAPWRMRAPHHRRYGASAFHAVLFVRRPDGGFDRFNWSYRAQAFRPVVGQGHVLLAERPACAPS